MTKLILGLILSILMIASPVGTALAQQNTDPGNGQPFNNIDDKIAQLEETIQELQTQNDDLQQQLDDFETSTDANFGAISVAMSGDESICDESFEGDNSLCQATEEFAGNYELLCENVPFVMEATQGVGIGLLYTFGGLNDAIDGINIPLNAMDNWKLKFTIPITNPSFSIPNPQLHTKTITIATIDFKIPTDFHVHASTKTFNIPDPTIDLGKPLSFIDTIPNIPDTVSDSTALAFEDLENCSIMD